MTYLRINDVDVYSEVSGAGDPVLLLHGGFCSLEAMRPQFDALVLSYRVFAFERPGHGRTADIDEQYSYARGVADTLAYLDAHELGPVHVVGYSDGAIIGLLLALEHPDRVRSLVAISANLDPSVFADPSAEPTAPRLTAPATWSGSPDAEGAVEKPDVERMHYERLSPDGPEHADAVLAKLLRLWTEQPDIDPAELRAVQAPTLIMSGDRDTVPPDHSLLIASSIAGAQLCIVPGTTHGLVAERPELISSLISQFLGHVR
jgi:pimeloyl-ACP methyl ester carboxylesterase